ncbi:MAG: hypothetical protein A3E21_07425 [Sulfurimonas sp. RIFCSPHIGHO2_12_FULL_36_9]|uniref:hypothetical protein n=1 Tax=Sulfurimonas sp. RIFCSPLOWO2_12_36_12 TaxID=1802253 RepID=UPI0008B2C91E|nr:hypothetical protein [Sulfurimonas sp. RIFCSPLOWO2_12_36_12]OHD96449.1 MAG: hypothetical protein A3E21_07425 [Sulfurimonas sp. RIFCSPHIGHO2_12_FULL_36_9]OHD99565.1 MAG: hypothetical protein A3J26_03160 [Sulfurimonas sp. RIFCSPLOWO2_02_FULL_36_28]OHE02400.1 MAG: hypothetical protein A2W82_10175 [Sulfurimonas sp. RIFCSPLOWO2_12_36_12]OHE07657.1 MAG: hypothetical protein A3K14_02310 [Sulfurimonas sp. RIFCSPLOWO2_12_FULL_36_74]
MVLLIETFIVIAMIYFIYSAGFELNIMNKVIAVTALVIIFLVMPVTMKALGVILLMMYFFINMVLVDEMDNESV